MKNLLPVLVLIAAGVCAAGFSAEFEGGLVWQARNDFRIPNNPEATEIDLVDLAGAGPVGAGRVFINWDPGYRHRLQITLAPLQIAESVELSEEAVFEGTVFPPGATDVVFKFNSWRVGYGYLFHEGESWRWRFGFTAKIRDAKISLEQENLYTEKTDLGFVPLLYLRGEYMFCPGTSFVLDFNGLAGGPGRAFDVSLKLSREISDRVSLLGGYRTIEGGADVESVYSFAWLNYAVLGLEARF
jgi:hypothetical protein